MRYVILRDDDTNALTPPAWLERLYRPFLERGLPVNLAVIPNVRTHVTYGDGILEGFLLTRHGVCQPFLPIGCNTALVDYIASNPGYHVVQHGCTHEFINGQCEFDHTNRADIVDRLERGLCFLTQAGFPRPETFVAPYDMLSSIGYTECLSRYRVISTSWFDRKRLPLIWWPKYACARLSRKPHWQVSNTWLLSHPPCFLSYRKPYASMLDTIQNRIQQSRLTVLVTHWWEFFRDGQPDDAFIHVLHELADWLGRNCGIRVVKFADVAAGAVPV